MISKKQARHEVRGALKAYHAADQGAYEYTEEWCISGKRDEVISKIFDALENECREEAIDRLTFIEVEFEIEEFICA